MLSAWRQHRHRRRFREQRNSRQCSVELLEPRQLLVADALAELTVVLSPTDVDAAGERDFLLPSEPYVDEWDVFSVEIWVSTPLGDLDDIDSAAASLTFNSSQIEPKLPVRYGTGFRKALSGLPELVGNAINIRADAIQSGVGDDGFALLATVDFLASGVPANVNDRNIGPVDLGLSITEATVELTPENPMAADVGPQPETELWAMLYDVNDDDRISFGDFAFFVAEFLQPVDAMSPGTRWWADFDKNELVNFGDFAYFAANFLQRKPSGDVAMPPNFPDAWRGGILESHSQVISAVQGGTITLPSGSSVTIPGGLLSTDQTVTLSLLSTFPNQPPSGYIVSLGTALVASFDEGIPSNSGLNQTLQPTQQKADSPTDLIEFKLPYGELVPDRVLGSAAMAEVVDLQGASTFVGVPSSYNGSGNSASFTVPLFGSQGAKNIGVSLANVRPLVAGVPIPSAGARSWNVSQSKWVEGTSGFDPSKKTLVLVHGMNSTVEDAYRKPGCVDLIMQKGGYKQVLGFNYNWTQGINESGRQLASFLDSLKSAGLITVDIEAHSEGVPVSLFAATHTQMNIGNIVMKVGPIFGTPAAMIGVGVQRILLTTLLNWGIVSRNIPIPGLVGDVTLEDVLKGN